MRRQFLRQSPPFSAPKNENSVSDESSHRNECHGRALAQFLLLQVSKPLSDSVSQIKFQFNRVESSFCARVIIADTTATETRIVDQIFSPVVSPDRCHSPTTWSKHAPPRMVVITTPLMSLPRGAT